GRDRRRGRTLRPGEFGPAGHPRGRRRAAPVRSLEPLEALEPPADPRARPRLPEPAGRRAGLAGPRGSPLAGPPRPRPRAPPPRSGLAREVIGYLGAAEHGAARFAYVSCDPATLARDIGLLTARGWVLAGLRAFDAFPMTHHLECVATLLRDPA